MRLAKQRVPFFYTQTNTCTKHVSTIETTHAHRSRLRACSMKPLMCPRCPSPLFRNDSAMPGPLICIKSLSVLNTPTAYTKMDINSSNGTPNHHNWNNPKMQARLHETFRVMPRNGTAELLQTRHCSLLNKPRLCLGDCRTKVRRSVCNA